MVLGLRTKNRKGTTVQVDYVIHIQEIKPWPPSQSLRSLRSVLLQFENGERHSGSTSTVVPSVGSGVGDGKIEFNESFRFPVTLCKELSMRGGEAETFQKNCLELNLYEPRRDKNMKGQLLGNAVIDLAEYGIIKEAISISTPMNCKRSFRNTTQPVLRLKIQPFEMEKTSSSPRDSLAKETSLDKDSRESVSALMSDEYAEEAEIASFTDDDVSSHSSNADLLSQNDSVDVRRLQKENVSGAVKENRERSTGQPVLPLALMPVKSVTKPVPAAYVSNKALKHNNKSSSRSSSVDLSSDPGSSENDDLSASGFSEKSLAAHPKKSPVQAHSSSSTASEATDAEVVPNNSLRGVHMKDIAKGVHEVDDGSRVRENAECPVKEGNCTNGSGTTVPPDTDLLVQEKLSVVNIAHSEVHEDNVSEEATSNRDIHQIVIENKNEDCCRNGREEILEKDNNNTKENDCSICHPADYFSHNISNVEQTSVKEMSKISQDAPGILSTHGSDVRAFIRGDLGVKASTLANGKAKHGKMSVRSSLDSSLRSTSGTSDQYIEEVKEIDMLEDACKDISDLEYQSSFADKVKCVARERQGVISGSKIRELELRIENLEGELREAAALEVGLYSVVAEHGISAHKVHAPARRLSRMYIHACKHWSLERRASAARSALSGLVLVAKACGNDVPRLAFWLSNSIVLRAIISEAFSDSCLPNSVGLDFGTNGFVKRKEKKSSPLRWKETAASERGQSFNFTLILDDWHDAHTFTAALEKIESWIFSRIIESVWWQTLTPHMQSPTEKGSKEKIGFNPRKSYGRISSLGDQYQESFSTNLWKRAFKDAYERLCPVRAGGHECGCLPVLARLVMEQCVARLDVAMFNAILRESVDEIPTDPVSDPISDSKVLPIPVGKSSFGVGAQLKNAIGTWSRWLTDLFGIDADDSPEEVDDERHNVATSFKSFHLLNALSDLLMLPKDMLLDKSIRKEVCPTFGAPLIKRILWNFVPDEFCPDPIPEIVLEALASEDSFDPVEESIENYPCGAAPIVYLPPSAALVSVIVGNLKSPTQLGRSRSSVLRKSHTSDDELENLDSPLASIAVNSIPATTGRKLKEFDAGNGGNLVRYQLLRQVWMDGD